MRDYILILERWRVFWNNINVTRFEWKNIIPEYLFFFPIFLLFGGI